MEDVETIIELVKELAPEYRVAVRPQLEALFKSWDNEETEKVKKAYEAELAELKAKYAGKLRNFTKTGRTIPVKYRDPANPANEWTGQGNPPRWMQPHLDGGKTKEDFLIQRPN